MSDDFEAIIGLEIHAQIATKSKMFCQCSSNSFDQEPNINTCPICMGFPGQLPVINNEAFLKGLKAALALNLQIPQFSKFDRKNYFYPDLPKGFQISQFDQPISQNGWLQIESDGAKKKIRITRLHLEDDAGKLTHVEDGTLCDYNRSGIALMEIVSEPDIRNSSEAVSYAKAIQNILRFVGASEADMEKGMMRFDASVSIRKFGDQNLNPRAEIKNLNSFNSLRDAINYEIERQISLWEEGKPLNSNITVGWSDDKKKTYFLRDKEGADDYRYFPEPDLPPLEISADFVEQLRTAMPELPNAKFERYQTEWKISQAEALLISSDVLLAKYFENIVSGCNDPKKAAGFLCSILIGRLNKDGLGLEESKVTAEQIAKIIKMINEGKISMNIAKNEVFEAVYTEGLDPEVVVQSKGLAQVSDLSALNEICTKVVEANAKSVEDFKKGKAAAMQFLVGQVMKQTRGQANAEAVQKIMKDLLS